MTFSATWDELTTSASRFGMTGYLSKDAQALIISARTADPRLNPKAVTASDSSTRYRRALTDSQAAEANYRRATQTGTFASGRQLASERWIGNRQA